MLAGHLLDALRVGDGGARGEHHVVAGHALEDVARAAGRTAPRPSGPKSLKTCCDAIDVGHDVAVREHHALGVAGGARRVDERGQVARLRLRGAAPHGLRDRAASGSRPRARTSSRVSVSAAGSAGRRPCGPRAAGAAPGRGSPATFRSWAGVETTQHLGLAVVQDVERLRRRQRGVDGHHHRARGEGGQVGERPLGPVLGEERHAVALLDAQRAQAQRRLLHRAPELVRADVPPLRRPPCA